MADMMRGVYMKVGGKSGKLWLIETLTKNTPKIYVHDKSNTNGFGGINIMFKIKDGSVLTLKGPWHSNATDLFMDTDIDLREEEPDDIA